MFWRKKVVNRITQVVLEPATYTSNCEVSFAFLRNWFFWNAYVFHTVLPMPSGENLDDYVKKMMEGMEIKDYQTYVYKIRTPKQES